MQTYCIEGLDKAQSDALLAQAFAAMYAPEAVYEHTWREGDLLIWNNIALQHARGHVGQGAPRTLRRVAFAARADADPWMLVRSLDRVTASPAN
jgi:taurine dioxygenase